MPNPSPSRSAARAVRPYELTRSNSNASSSLTAENRKDVEDVCKKWTDKKHNLYLNQLEASFVKQLHQSKVPERKSFEQNERDINVSQRLALHVRSSSGQNDSWQKTNYDRSGPLSYTSANSHSPLADMENLKLCGTDKHRKRNVYHGSSSCSQEFSTSNTNRGDYFDITTEGSGQNFMDGDDKKRIQNMSVRQNDSGQR